MKIAITADLHIHTHGNNSYRLDDCLDAVEKIWRYCRDNYIETLFILGDIYHLRDNIPSLSLFKSYQLFEGLKENGMKVFAVAGNHDAPFKVFVPGLSNIRHLSSLMMVFDENCRKDFGYYRINDCNFFFVNCVEDAAKLKEILHDIRDKDIPCEKGYNVLLSHFDVSGFAMDNGQESKAEVSMSDLACFDRVFLGHLHSYQEKANTVYVGSPLQLTFGDREKEHGFVVFDTETKQHEFVKLDTRKFIVHSIDKAEDIQTIDAESFEFKDNIVKLCIKEYVGAEWLADIKKKFEDKFAPKTLRVECSDVMGGIDTKTTSQASDDVKENISEMVVDWLNKCSLQKDKVDGVISIAADIIKECK